MVNLSYRSDVDAAFFEVRGSVRSEDYRAAIEELFRSEFFHTGMSAIWDVRKADLRGLTREAIRRAASFARQMAPQRGEKWKTAIVVDSPLAFGLARMFESLAYGIQFQMNIVHTVEEACAWLQESSEVIP